MHPGVAGGDLEGLTVMADRPVRCQVSPERTAMSTPAATGADQRPARRHGSLVAAAAARAISPMLAQYCQ